MDKQKFNRSNLKNVQISSKTKTNGVLILAENTVSENVLPRVVSECKDSNYFHKFIIQNTGPYKRNYILKTIIDFVHPYSLRPVYFTKNDDVSYFYAKDCLDAIMLIIRRKFVIPHPSKPKSPFSTTIYVNALLHETNKLKVHRNVCEVINKRMDTSNNILDLNNFAYDTDLIDYCPLEDIKWLEFIMKKSAEISPKVLILRNNSLKNIYPLRAVKSSVESLDIRNNLIEDVKDLIVLSEFPKLNKLYLSENPLCIKYDFYNYVVDVKKYCPALEYLDGTSVTFPEYRKHFCCPKAGNLAKQFLEYFFTLYDSNNRVDLKDLYDTHAMFSVNSKIIPGQSNSDTVRLEHYGLNNSFTVFESYDIMKLFEEFPKSYHDPYMMVSDVTIYKESYAHLVVNGIFRENTQILSFNRSFYLRRDINDQFRIVNEQLHVSNATDYQIGWSFMYPTYNAPYPFHLEEYREMDRTFQKLTNVNLRYCQKYLTVSNYDLKQALILFSKLYSNDEVPLEAFQRYDEDDKESMLLCDLLSTKVLKKHPKISARSLWNTLNKDRLERNTDPFGIPNPSILKFYKKSSDDNRSPKKKTFLQNLMERGNNFSMDMKQKDSFVEERNMAQKPVGYVFPQQIVTNESNVPHQNYSTSSNRRSENGDIPFSLAKADVSRKLNEDMREVTLEKPGQQKLSQISKRIQEQKERLLLIRKQLPSLNRTSSK